MVPKYYVVMNSTLIDRQREKKVKHSLWLEQIIKGDNHVLQEPAIRDNSCLFAFRVSKFIRVKNPCTGKTTIQMHCTCAYEHESFQYVHEDGSVDKIMLDKILTAIRIGRCEHVRRRITTSQTSVTPLHALAAVGNAELVKQPPVIGFTPTPCFQLTPYHLAVIHNQQPLIQTLGNSFNFTSFNLPIKTQDLSENNHLRYTLTNVLKLSIDLENIASLMTILDGVSNIYQYSVPTLYAICTRKTTSLDTILKSYNENSTLKFHSFHKQMDIFQGTFTAVLSNQPEALSVLMKNLNIETAFCLEPDFTQLHLAHALGHSKCAKILQQWLMSSKERKEMFNYSSDMESTGTRLSPIHLTLQKLRYYNLTSLRTAPILTVLETFTTQGHNINQIHNGKTPLHYCVAAENVAFFNILVLYKLIQLGSNINLKDSNGEIALYYLMLPQVVMHVETECLKWLIRMMLFYNIDKRCITHWKYVKDRTAFAKLDDVYKGLSNDFIECGFQPIKEAPLQPLTKICRDTLRHAMPGQALFHYIETTNMPKSVKDYLLMRSMLDWKPHLQIHENALV